MRRVVAALLATAALAACSGSPERQAERAAAAYVKAQLRAPSTARLAFTSTVCDDAGTCFVSGEVEAKNALGVPIRQRFSARVERDAQGRFQDAGAHIF